MITSIAVVVCTYRRNEPLQRLLAQLARCADRVAERARVGVVVVDDNPDQRARAVVSEMAEREGASFALGVHYRTSGKGNISVARNIACETGAGIAEWIAMTDDDCEPETGWLDEFLTAQQTSGAGAVTGPCLLTLPDGAPSWLHDEPFLEDAQFRMGDLEPMPTAATNNSMLRAQFWIDHPTVRFLPELGVVGGEDMVFYRTARRHGLRIAFAAKAVVHGREPAERATLRHQLRSRFWLGNTEFVTNHTLGDAGRLRLLARGSKGLLHALARPATRLARGQRPQLRYCAASVLRALGLISGAAGLRLRHH